MRMAKKIENEKVRPITLTDSESGEKYILEFNRETVKFAEQRGFNINAVSDAPMTRIPELFYYAFRMHHKNVARDRTDKIIFEDWGGIGGIPDGVLERLGMLYSATFDSFKADEDGEVKNSKVTVEL